MAIYIQEGKFIDYTPTGGDVAAGSVIKLGDDYFGIAIRNIKNGELGALATSGVFEVDTDAAISAGAKVYWNAGDTKVQAAAISDYYFGRSVLAAAGGKVKVFLNAANIGDFTAIDAQSVPAVTQATVGALTAEAPDAITADAEDSDNTKLIADVSEIHTQVAAAVADLDTLKTAVNAAKTDLAELVTTLQATGVLKT